MLILIAVTCLKNHESLNHLGHGMITARPRSDYDARMGRGTYRRTHIRTYVRTDTRKKLNVDLGAPGKI